MGRKEAEALVPEGFVTSKIVYMTGFWAEALLYGERGNKLAPNFGTLSSTRDIFLSLRRGAQHHAAKADAPHFLLEGLPRGYRGHVRTHHFTQLMIEGYAYQTSLESPVHFMRNTTNWARYSFPVILALVIWIGDALVIYRCFIIWQRNYYAILLPLVLLLASISFHSVNLWWFGNPTARSLEDMRPIMSTTFPLHFAQNVVTTGMIAFKLWQHHRRTRRVALSDSNYSEHNPPSKSLIPSWLHGGENDVENQRTGHSNMPVVTTVTEEHRMDDISHTIKLPDHSRRSRVGASDSSSSPNERDDDRKVPVDL
ncbi:hypothetical protein CC1G_14931 [Coprinopsis cinerea okayama7|uniref:Uncharacterized protein n=1 Tax=Coprinopsis cinerea (strain Okayama-7 / 130 / ATCC MYA-4618 / FGSC 9003) TaxID=240176 RepID=D6RPB3_COPC7|nr:hypothetical protein CC1G_14931 [Coprinopsis cinerea okayama7\|eukprot:XP_002910600.1 hypothetical protein CC1G_14931 [Coprinopsis cinerea okayama7\